MENKKQLNPKIPFYSNSTERGKYKNDISYNAYSFFLLNKLLT